MKEIEISNVEFIPTIPRLLILVSVVLCLSVPGNTLVAQAEESFWAKYEEACSDPSGFTRKRDLLKEEKDAIPARVTFWINAIAARIVAGNYKEAAHRLRLLEDLTRLHSLLYRSSKLKHRLEFARSLDKTSAKYLLDAHTGWVRFTDLHGRNRAKSGTTAKEMIQLGTEVLTLCEKAGEDFFFADACELVARYHVRDENWVAAVRLLTKARKAFHRHGRGDRENHVTLELRRIAVAHGVRMGKDGNVVQPRRKTVKKRRNPEKYPPVETRFRKDNGPEQFPSACPWNTRDPMLWKGLGLRREKTVTWPLGYGSVVRWSGGSKIYLDLENDGSRLIRLKAVSGTDNLVDIKVRYARSVRRYRLLMRGLGEEKYLGLPIRYITTRVFPLRYTRACHLEGTFKGRRFVLIDDDVNGNYDDFGRDMIRFDSGRIQPLSKVLNIGGTLYSLGRVKADGSKILFEEYVGDSGILRVDWKGNGRRKPAILVFQCVQGEFTPSYFNLAGGEPLRIPDGHYRFMHGIITKGKDRKRRFVLIGPGKSEVFEVERDQTVVKTMGAPFDVRAAVTRAEDGVQIPGSRIKIYGAMKEEYHHFYPDSFRPRISVRIVDGPAVAMEERPGRPGKAEADRLGHDVMWFPKNLEFDGDASKKYQVKVEIDDDLLGAIRGNWNEAPVILKHP